jgi:tripartite-type tricarboxylate transporter receptor subunit TctC
MYFVRTIRIIVAMLLVAALLPAVAARADEYPNHPITIVVPYTPGGTVDLLARALGQRLTATWGQQIIIDNRPGAGGSVGAAFVAKARPDGYTLLMSTNAPLTTNMALYPSIGYDAEKDFAPIVVLGASGTVIAVNPSVKAKNIQELIALAKAQPSVLAASTSGNGSTADLTVSEFNRIAGVKLRAVPYRGGVPSLTAAMSGEVPIVFSDIVPALPYIKAGKLRALAVTSADPSPAAMNIPTLAASGFPRFDIVSWVGLLAPQGTPPNIVHKLYAEVDRVLLSKEFHHDLVAINIAPMAYDPVKFAAYLKTEIVRWQKMVKESNLQVQ